MVQNGNGSPNGRNGGNDEATEGFHAAMEMITGVCDSTAEYLQQIVHEFQRLGMIVAKDGLHQDEMNGEGREVANGESFGDDEVVANHFDVVVFVKTYYSMNPELVDEHRNVFIMLKNLLNPENCYVHGSALQRTMIRTSDLDVVLRYEKDFEVVASKVIPHVSDFRIIHDAPVKLCKFTIGNVKVDLSEDGGVIDGVQAGNFFYGIFRRREDIRVMALILKQSGEFFGTYGTKNKMIGGIGLTTLLIYGAQQIQLLPKFLVSRMGYFKDSNSTFNDAYWKEMEVATEYDLTNAVFIKRFGMILEAICNTDFKITINVMAEEQQVPLSTPMVIFAPPRNKENAAWIMKYKRRKLLLEYFKKILGYWKEDPWSFLKRIK